MSKILNCDLHDYLEIACLYQYHVTLILRSGDEYRGIPQTTCAKTKGDTKYEVLIFKCDDGDTIDVDLLQLTSMQVNTPNEKFTHISF